MFIRIINCFQLYHYYHGFLLFLFSLLLYHVCCLYYTCDYIHNTCLFFVAVIFVASCHLLIIDTYMCILIHVWIDWKNQRQYLYIYMCIYIYTYTYLYNVYTFGHRSKLGKICSYGRKGVPTFISVSCMYILMWWWICMHMKRGNCVKSRERSQLEGYTAESSYIAGIATYQST